MEDENQSVLNASELLFRVNAFISRKGAKAEDDEGFNELALALFAFQFQNVPIYRRLCERRGVRPDSIERWGQIPALPAAAFKEHQVSSLPEEERSRVFHSSGTTEHVPSRHFHSVESLSIYEASALPWFERHVLGDDPDLAASAVYVFLTPNPVLAPHSSLVHMFQTIRQKFDTPNSFYAGTCLHAQDGWNLEFDLLEATVQGAIDDGRPAALLGTAFSFVQWMDYLAVNKTKFRLPPGSRIMETGGYKGRSRVVAKAELRRLMTRHFGVPEARIVTEYGMSELSSQAYDRVVGQTGPDAGIFRFPPWVRTQIISPETGAAVGPGETGLLRVFDLANIHSVIALQTEDLAVSRAGGFELVGRAESAAARGCSLLAAT